MFIRRSCRSGSIVYIVKSPFASTHKQNVDYITSMNDSAGIVKEEPMNKENICADIGEERRYKELKVKPCGNGAHFTAIMDAEDCGIVIFGEGGWAMGYIDYPMGTANWIVSDECKPGMHRYWKTCSKCGRKQQFFNYIDARYLKQEHPFCECGAKIIGVEERLEFE